MSKAFAMTAYVDNPARWRDRAEEARIQAEQMSDDDTKRMMLRVAEGYERMAHRAERRIAEGRTPPEEDEPI